MNSDSKRWVQFRVPDRLVKRADTLATVFETDRTDILISALRDYLRDAAHDDEIKQEIAGAYYEDEITFDQLQDLVGHEEAANFRVLKQQLSMEFIEEIAEELDES
jgi:predicted transcriptional regulator